MTKTASHAGFVVLLLSAWLARPLAARAADPNLREADKHFQHGVALYVEADYRAALVEFSRAYALAPNGIVLFNVAETQYQLRDYASALSSFEHFLAETSLSDPHRALAESNVRELRTRVGRLRITTVPAGAEISIDERVIGKTPFDEPVTVSIGHLTVRGTAPGRLTVTRQVEVAAEDDVAVALELLPAPATARAADPQSDAATTTTTAMTITDRASPPAPSDWSSWRTAGWITTGVVGGGALTFGVLAFLASRDLKHARDETFPAQPATIQHFSDRTVRLSSVADILGGATLLIGGITLISTLSAHGETPSTSVAVGPGSLLLQGRF